MIGALIDGAIKRRKVVLGIAAIATLFRPDHLPEPAPGIRT